MFLSYIYIYFFDWVTLGQPVKSWTKCDIWWRNFETLKKKCFAVFSAVWSWNRDTTTGTVQQPWHLPTVSVSVTCGFNICTYLSLWWIQGFWKEQSKRAARLLWFKKSLAFEESTQSKMESNLCGGYYLFGFVPVSQRKIVSQWRERHSYLFISQPSETI